MFKTGIKILPDQIALETFWQGEKSRLIIPAEYEYGEGGNEALVIPANATLEYEVALFKNDELPNAVTLLIHFGHFQAGILMDISISVLSEFLQRQRNYRVKF